MMPILFERLLPKKSSPLSFSVINIEYDISKSVNRKQICRLVVVEPFTTQTKSPNHLRWPNPLSKRNKIKINIGTFTSPKSLQIQKRIRSNMFPTEPNTSQIYKTHKILERARNIFDTSAVIYKRSPFALPYVCTDHTQPAKGQSSSQTGDSIAVLYLARRFASPVLNL
jgi:hypothetical protein